MAKSSSRVLPALLGAALALGAACLLGCGGLKELEGLNVQEVDLGAVRDGSYVGAQRNLPVTAKVRVTVRDGRITDIRLLRHFHGPGHGAEAVLREVQARQSLQVDAVSGATYSSKVLLLAVRAALQKGM